MVREALVMSWANFTIRETSFNIDQPDVYNTVEQEEESL